MVIAAGGDGTLNEVVSGLAGSSTVLGVLPAGTMNVFAREMGIPFDSLERAFGVIEAGFVREVDLFEANGAPFVQMAGVGFDAQVIEETTWESKKMLGPLAYLLAAVKVLGERPPKMEIICADGRREKGVAVLAGNGSLYGGQFKFFRNATTRTRNSTCWFTRRPATGWCSIRCAASPSAASIWWRRRVISRPRRSRCARTAKCRWRWTASGSAGFPKCTSRKPRATCGCWRPRDRWPGTFAETLKSLLRWPRGSPNSKPPASL